MRDISEIIKPELSNLPATSLITLYIRAMESQRPDALIKDERTEAVVRQLDQETLSKTAALTDDSTRLVLILKTRDFDRFARDFLDRHPDAVVVHIGCGFDTRFQRLDNGLVEWYDLDLPEVIALRRKLIGDEGPALSGPEHGSGVEGDRYHLLGCSVLEDAWLEVVSMHHQHPFLFLAEGVFMYFTEAQVKMLVLSLHERFPGAELVFDAYSPFLRWSHNMRVARKRIGAPLHWALKNPQDLEGWSTANLTGKGIRLLDQRYPFQYPEPRIRRALRIRLVP